MGWRWLELSLQGGDVEMKWLLLLELVLGLENKKLVMILIVNLAYFCCVRVKTDFDTTRLPGLYQRRTRNSILRMATTANATVLWKTVKSFLYFWFFYFFNLIWILFKILFSNLNFQFLSTFSFQYSVILKTRFQISIINFLQNFVFKIHKTCRNFL